MNVMHREHSHKYTVWCVCVCVCFCVWDTSYTWNKSDGTMNKGHNFYCIIFLYTHSMDMKRLYNVQGIGEPTVHSGALESTIVLCVRLCVCMFTHTCIVYILLQIECSRTDQRAHNE